MIKKCCDSCGFWVSNEDGRIFAPESGHGRCHRNAPLNGSDDRHEWPPTMRYDWCGDHKNETKQTLIEQREDAEE